MKNKKNTNKSTLLAVAGCNPWAYLDSEAQCAVYSSITNTFYV